MMEKSAKPYERAQQTTPTGCEMNVFTGIQYSATGVFGYSFRQNEKEVLRIDSAVLPNPDIHLQGFGAKLVHRAFDASITILPGMRRVLEDEHGSVQGFYEYFDVNVYRIAVKGAEAYVYVRADFWEVTVDMEAAARISRVPQALRTRFTENGYDMENRFTIAIADTVPEALYPYILAIPVLGF
ncbi:MAG: hypothetical protein IKB82_04840 [Clostridia bacterium]|nr:hypothetical protein [Clostridia bacterium]